MKGSRHEQEFYFAVTLIINSLDVILRDLQMSFDGIPTNGYNSWNNEQTFSEKTMITEKGWKTSYQTMTLVTSSTSVLFELSPRARTYFVIKTKSKTRIAIHKKIFKLIHIFESVNHMLFPT